MQTNLYIDGLGYRNVVKDFEQIKWYFQQMANLKSKADATRYWLNLREWHSEYLLKCEAYELLEFIKIKATDAKVKKREAARLKAKEKAEKEMKAFNNWYKGEKMTSGLINTISLN